MKRKESPLLQDGEYVNNLNCKVLVSNGDTPFIRNLWKDYEIITVEAKRTINSKGNKRGNVNEVLIKNY